MKSSKQCRAYINSLDIAGYLLTTGWLLLVDWRLTALSAQAISFHAVKS